ncbi:helix-turn-helix domain-containing protein [Burkholderia ambifaria]|uniref:helix-turn-helix transcriptional regulator n=1 Tax=Burkholderia ambifaria TaxID=152480 RepID=UPI0009D9354A
MVRAVIGGKNASVGSKGIRRGEPIVRALSPCEADVLLGCIEGLTIAEIARIKGRSIKTISRQKRLAYQKLGISSDFELFRDGPKFEIVGRSNVRCTLKDSVVPENVLSV